MRMDVEQDEGLTLDEYQKLALESAVYEPRFAIMYPALGLASEAGEVAGKISKLLRDYSGVLDDPVWRQSIKKEIGDVLWNTAALAAGFGFSLEDIADTNLTKLASRMERGVIQGSGDDR